MSLTILEILDLGTPLGIGTALSLDAFTIFYMEAEDLITSAQNRDAEILNLYDVIIADIGASTLSNSKSLKTSTTTGYRIGKERSTTYGFIYYEKVVFFVEQLQLLVLDRYTTVDEFYEEEMVTVSQTFADISEDAGYPISPQYIEDIS